MFSSLICSYIGYGLMTYAAYGGCFLSINCGSSFSLYSGYLSFVFIGISVLLAARAWMRRSR